MLGSCAIKRDTSVSLKVCLIFLCWEFWSVGRFIEVRTEPGSGRSFARLEDAWNVRPSKMSVPELSRSCLGMNVGVPPGSKLCKSGTVPGRPLPGVCEMLGSFDAVSSFPSGDSLQQGLRESKHQKARDWATRILQRTCYRRLWPEDQLSVEPLLTQW